MRRIAVAIIKKWLRKGNMARCMRDILPRSNLNFKEREEVAKIVHNVVRWKRWYDFVMDYYGMEKTEENYVKIAMNEIEINEKEVEEAIPEEKYVAIRYSFSDFLANFLKDKEDFVHHLNREAKTTLCINLNKITRKKAMNMLEKEGIKSSPSTAIETGLLAESRARYSQLVKEGYAHVQDEASQLIAKIATMHGKKILDYCAGNGGKTLAMASMTENGNIYVHDIDSKRIETLKRRALKYGAKIKMFDDSGQDSLFDVVLVDAPCTGVGAARRNPEAKYVENLGGYPERQEEIVKKAWNLVEENGYLIYSICSFLSPETKAIEKINGKPAPLNMKWLRKYENGYITWLPEGDILFVSIRKN